jgi:hypothetical protein
MKNINPLKVVLPLIFELGCVVHGSSNDDLRDDLEIDHSPVATHSAQQLSVSEENRVYLFGDRHRYSFIALNRQGEITDTVNDEQRWSASLPHRLFKKLVNENVCRQMLRQYSAEEKKESLDRLDIKTVICTLKMKPLLCLC